MEYVTLTCTAQEAAAIQLLIDSGVFGIKGGSAEIHFNTKGGISAIKAHVNLLSVRPLVVVVESKPSYPQRKTLKTDEQPA